MIAPHSQYPLTPNAELARSLMVSQYEALRSEINQRLDLRQQVVTFTLLVAASFFGLGLQSWASGVTVLCYPIIALFLACAWAQHDQRIGQLAKFLREIEDRYLGNFGPGWESYRRATFASKKHHLASGVIELPTRSVFLTSQALAMLLGVARSLPLPVSQPAMMATLTWLLIVDVLAFVVTVPVLRHRRERTPGRESTLGIDQALMEGE